MCGAISFSRLRKMRSDAPIDSTPTTVRLSSGCHFLRSSSMVLLSEQGQTHTFISTFFWRSAMRSRATFVFPVPISIKSAPTLRRRSLLMARACCSVEVNSVIEEFLRHLNLDMGGERVGRVKGIARAEQLFKPGRGDGL